VSIIHYKAREVFKHSLPGLDRFRGHFRVYGHGATPIDRTERIAFPVKTLNLFLLPDIDNFDKSYAECCDERAVELLERAEQLDVPVYVFWSGGIDSTTVLVSLLKAASAAALERITVLMSAMSVAEYPDFYVEHIVARKLHRAPAAQFPFLLGERNLIISGEHNDQLFGSDIIADAVLAFGFDKVVAKYDPDLMRAFLAERMADDKLADWYTDLYDRLAAGAPVPLTTNYHRLWWNNFALKWQNVFMRMLSFADRPLTLDWVKTFYAPFFCTSDFQRWSMCNLDKRVREDWRGYKWVAKDLIYDFTKDERYRDNKLKLGSLKFLTAQSGAVGFIDGMFGFHKQMAPEAFYEPINDFMVA
jgi:hypothetical protein